MFFLGFFLHKVFVLGWQPLFSSCILCLQINNFMKTWSDAGLKEMYFQNFGIVYPNVPKQKTGYECVFYNLIQNFVCSSYHVFVVFAWFLFLFFIFSCIPSNDGEIFAMKFMELFCPRNPLSCAFSHTDIPHSRIIYAHDILLSEHNSDHDAKDLACTYNQMVRLIFIDYCKLILNHHYLL